MAEALGGTPSTKAQRIIHLITTYPFSCDLIVTYFYTSAFSNRFISRVVPFPPAFITEEGDKNIRLLRKVLKLIPPLAILRKLLKYSEDFEYIDLLYWIFSTIEPETLELTETSHLTLPIEQQPNIIFGIRANPDDEEAWNIRKGQKTSMHAFYGTNLENLNATMTNGLNPRFSTATAPLYGEGIYLTNQMSVSLLFSPFNEGWKFSMMGEKIRVLVLCEVIDDSSKIKRLRKQRSVEEQLNCTYILVKDKDYVRVKYFFIYTKNSSVNEGDRYFSRKMCLRVFLIAFLMLMYIWYSIRKQEKLDFSEFFLKP